MTFWQLRSGSDGAVTSSTTAIAGTQVFANAVNQQAWLSSKRLVPVNPHHVYEVKGSFRRPTTAGSAGGIYLAVLLFDENKAEIAGDGPWWFFPLANASLTDTNWHTYTGRFGNGTSRPIPATARFMSVGAILNYDGAVAGNRIYEVAGLGITATAPHPSETTDDGGLGIETGTANALYTPSHTFQQGTYLIRFYNCLGGASQVYFVRMTAEATSGTIVADGVNRNFDQLTLWDQPPFILKVRSPSAVVRFKVYNAGSPTATLSNGAGSCSQFLWTQVGL